MSIPIPSTWKDRYVATARADGLGVTFYSYNNLTAGFGGMLFQLYPYDSPSDYSHIPNTTLLTKLKVGENTYYIVCRKPSDVQFDMQYQEEYQQMYADIPRMLEGMEYFLPTV